ncbi:MAG: peptidylprolyl isomerase [Candidatus Eisenbacteria bacterium]
MNFWKSVPVVMLALFAASPLAAQRLDGIAAVVNNEVVLESDVEEQLGAFIAQTRLRPDSMLADTLRRQVLEQIIDDKLVVAEARRQGITVGEADVKRQLDQAIAQKKEEMGGEAAFVEQLKAENITEAKLRDKYRAEIERLAIRNRLLERMFPRKPLPAAEAVAFFKSHPQKFPKFPAELRLAVIQLPPTPDSVDDAKGRAAALAARRRIAAGEKFAKVAAEVSQDPSSSKSGGDLGFFAQGTMDPALEKAAFTIKTGQLSEPVKTPYGWHIVETLERDTLKSAGGRDSLDRDGKPLLEAHVRHILVRVTVDDDDIARARKLAERVHGEAAKGTNFGTLVRRYSKYSGPQDAEGDLGFISVARLQPEIRAGLDTLEVGQVSGVLTNQLGFNIFKLLDRHPERAYTVEEIRDELPGAVADIQSREKYEDWVKGLRTKAQVQYR